jgi:hypothetical protein
LQNTHPEFLSINTPILSHFPSILKLSEFVLGVFLTRRVSL